MRYFSLKALAPFFPFVNLIIRQLFSIKLVSFVEIDVIILRLHLIY